ncbi:MAG: protein translocase subunit SecD [Verrucomicrobiota bacterium]
MKSSLIWRFALIVVVIVAWTVSLFPLHDREVHAIFQKMARPQVEDLQQQADSARETVEKLQAKLEDAEEGSRKAEKLSEQLAEAQAEADEAEELLEQYDELIETVEKLDDQHPEWAWYRKYDEAAKRGADRRAIRLREFVPVPLQPSASNNLVLSRVRNKAAGKLRLGLDLQGGTEFIIGFDADEIKTNEPPERIRDQIITILSNRVDSMGVAEPEIKATGKTTISLRMPSVTEDSKADIRRTIKQTAKLNFHLVHENNQDLANQYRESPEDFEAPLGYTRKEMEIERDGDIQTEILFIKRRPTDVKGEDVSRANASFGEFGSYSISLEFTSEGARNFSTVTSDNVGRRLAIVLDGKVYSAPNINEAISGGRAEITGSFSPEEAQRLAGVISAGNLPVSISIDSEFGTDPTLGKDSIRSGVISTIWGLAAVVVFMLFYYRIAGAVAILALAVNILLVLGTLTLAGATITLPGIAGIVLTIGMAVDANVLIFERIREERKHGKTLWNALKAGYNRAFVTIVDANLTTLITALILFHVGTGPIRGFAVTLSIGILASMFTALFMTRAIFDLLISQGWVAKLSMFSLFENPNFKFLNVRKIAVSISVAVLLISLGTVLVRGRDALSIDFTGGTAVALQHESDAPPTIADIRKVLQDAGFGEVRPGYKSAAQEESRLLEISLPERSTDEAQADPVDIANALNEAFPEANFTIGQENRIGGLVGKRFQLNALLAGVLAAVAVILYISFRFEFTYGVAAVVALVHDVLIAMGIYLLCGRQLSLTVVAALLTIMGYSLNDTIVVFDRIREDLALITKGTYRDIINISINQTLSRTVLTSLTTLLVVVILFLFGGGAINDFALIMLIGVIVGTYSSIFVASSMVAIWHKTSRQHAEQ